MGCIWLLVVGVPLVGIVASGLPVGYESGSAAPPLGAVWWTTGCWSIGVASVACGLAIPAARALIIPSGWRWVALSLMVVAAVSPPWAMYYAWWITMPPGTMLYDAAVAWADVGLLRQAVLACVMVGWTWPLVVCCVATASLRWGADERSALAIDSGRWRDHQRARLRVEWPGIAFGWLLAVLLTAGCTTAFDLAGVRTLANEVRAAESIGATPRDVLRMTWPLVVVVAAGAVLVLKWTAGRSELNKAHLPGRRGGRFWVWACIALFVGVPVTLLGWLATDVGIGRAEWVAGDAVMRTAMRGGLVGVLAVAIVLAGRRVWRGSGWTVPTACWVAAALLPAPLAAMLVSAGWRAIWPEMLETSLPWTLALLIRGGAVAVLSARWLSASESRGVHDLREADAAPWWSLGIAARWTGLTVGVAAIVLAASDVSMAAVLAPPLPSPPLAVTLLNAVHYQRPELIVGVLMWIPALAMMCGTGLIWILRSRRSSGGLLGLLVVVLIMGCDRRDSSDPWPPIPFTRVIGHSGLGAGQFHIPRALSAAPDGSWAVVDKSGRVQRFQDDAPVSQWRMPSIDQGLPTGLGTVQDNQLAVADTHEYRVAVFDGDGHLEQSLGAYGMSPGEMIYPTDVLTDQAGRWYVSEYGGNDRIQVFNHDGGVRLQIGGPGESPGFFRRPQSMAFAPDERILWVADSGNHRVQGFDPETGALLASVGDAVLRYPYGVDTLPDGSLVVAEYGRHVLSRWSPTGVLLGTWGGWGTAPGRLRMPWGVVYDDAHDRLLVLDTGNDRVMSVERSALGGPWQGPRRE